jgi:PAS domain S-box-containing protein
MIDEPLREIEVARLLLEAARYLGETLEPRRVYERFREIMAEAIPHDGVVVSSYDEAEGVIRCDYAWVDGRLLDPAILPPLSFNESGGMQSEVIRTGRPLLTNDVAGRVQDDGTYYDVDAEGTMRKVPDEGPPRAQAAMMVPIRHEGSVVGVVQLMSDHEGYRPAQLELAEAMVAQLGAAVRNARLHEERLRLEASAAAARATALERERAAHVLEAVGDGVLYVREQGTVEFWNRAAEAVTGLPREAALGRTLAELGPEWAALASTVPAAEGGDLPRSVALPVDVEGREAWLSFVAVRLDDGAVYAFRDVTAERELEVSRSDIVATVSHELRTPLTAILGAARTLLREDVELGEKHVRQLLDMIATQATRLSDVTESVLLAGRLDRDELVVAAEAVDVVALVREIVDALPPSLPVVVRVADDAGGEAFAHADANRLRQVLVNLLDNAARYAPPGSTVTARASRADGETIVEVADEGPGIPPGEVERIFDKFYRSVGSRQRAPGGTGLGLYISRGLTERMGGRLSVSSVEGVGSTFKVHLTDTGAPAHLTELS